MAFASVLFVVSVSFSVSCGKAAEREMDVEVALKLVSAGMQANYSQIKSLEAEVQRTEMNPEVKHEETRVLKATKGHGVLTWSVSPKSVEVRRLLFDRQKIRCDTHFFKEAHQFVFVHPTWTQYSPEMKVAWIRLRSQMSNWEWFDVRDVGSPNESELLSSLLEKNSVVSATETTEGAVSKIVLKINSQKNVHSITFDAKQGFLPVARVSQDLDGKVEESVDIEYQSVLDGRALIMSSERVNRFVPAILPEKVSASNGTQTIVSELKRIVSINEPVDSAEFELALAGDTVVSDAANPKKRASSRRDLTGTSRSAKRILY